MTSIQKNFKMVRFLESCVILLILAKFSQCEEMESLHEIETIFEPRSEAVRFEGGRFKRETPEEDFFEIEDKVDRFAGNLKWSRFVKSVGNIAHGAVEIMKNYSTTLSGLLSEKVSPDADNKVLHFASNFSDAFIPVVNYFRPIHAKLEHSAAHTRINPLIDLQTISSCIDLAKKNSTKMRDMTRLKWIEINALATTVHHVFDHLSNIFVSDGLNGIDDAVQIAYPSWLTNAAVRDDKDTFENMDVESMVTYIDKEMVGFGEKNHLIRGLERILRKKTKEWNPRETDYNLYCYGNNEYGIILDEFDLLTDAALFLSMADIKYTLIQMIRTMNKEVVHRAAPADAAAEKKTDISSTFDELVKSMTARIDKKIKFAETKDSNEVVPGPLVFKCDRPPAANETKDGPILSAPNCPPGVYVQNGQVFHNGSNIKLPEDTTSKITLPDGKEIGCIKLEHVGTDPNGTVLLHEIKNGVCVDTNGTEIQNCKVKTVPVVVDETGTPVIRVDPTEYPKPPAEWGKFSPPDGLSPLPNGTQPVLDPQGGPSKPNDTNPGFLDQRTPVFDPTTVAQFLGAFGGYLESELVLSPDGKCAGTCLDYHRPTQTCSNKTTHCDLYRKSHCEPGKDCMKQSSCPSKARRCVRAASKVSICPAKSGSGRLYDWLNINGKEAGSEGSSCRSSNATAEVIDPTKAKCDGEVMVAKERWEMEDGVILNTPQYCELCLCICDDPLTKEGHHYFDLSPSVADVSKGLVVTAVKFEQTGQTMRLIIEEGQLLDGEQGGIDASTLKLQSKSEKDSSPSTTIVPLGSTGFKKINLDIVHGLLNEVVSGVRFRLEEDRLELDVQFVKIDKSGVVKPPVTEWRSPNFPTPTIPRKKIDLHDTCSPLYQNGPSQPFNVPENAEFIEFDATSLEKDVGQAVVPFWDVQPLQHPDARHRRPLTSVGILYKSKRNSGGIITPTVAVWEKSFLEGGSGPI